MCIQITDNLIHARGCLLSSLSFTTKILISNFSFRFSLDQCTIQPTTVSTDTAANPAGIK